MSGPDHATGQLWRFVVRYRGRFAAGLSCVVLTTGITLAAPWVLKLAVDDLTLGVTDAKLAYYAALIIGIAVVGGGLRFATRQILIGASRAIEYDIRNAVFAHLQRLPLAYFHANRTGDLMSRATNDLNAVRMMVGPAVLYASTTGLTFVVAVLFMLSINVRLTLLALLPLPLVTVTARSFGRVIHERFERIQSQLSDISAVTQEALAGVRVVRAYGREARELERFRAANAEYVRRNRSLIRLQGLFFPSMGLFMGVAELIVLWLGAREVMADRMSIGELVAFNTYLAMLAWPMIAFGWVTNLLQRGRASWARLVEVLDSEATIDDRHVTRPDLRPEEIRGEVEFRDLTFSYESGGGQTRNRDRERPAEGPAGHVSASDTSRPVLQGVSLRVPVGTTVAIVGRTGAGKTTLAALLARLHETPPGTVFVDGVDVREMPLATLRGAIGFVPQEPFLFSATIGENITFAASGSPGPARGAPGAPGADVVRVAEMARLARDVEDFPQGYETRVGERGITLSGGQKQRTALARALYTDPRILILDDAMSAVDTQTEHEILEALRRFRQRRTTLIVSHRVSTVRDADRIVVLEDGRIREMGSHDELVALNGFYAQLQRRQALEQELAAS